ncbi:hypothetical protein K523DRAFT_422452 [Schizophyllum commune Tattone D]|nr:hypothetical protein K523DRAFT_422452 [Schizophyllum commune Tattone D]
MTACAPSMYQVSPPPPLSSRNSALPPHHSLPDHAQELVTLLLHRHTSYSLGDCPRRRPARPRAMRSRRARSRRRCPRDASWRDDQDRLRRSTMRGIFIVLRVDHQDLWLLHNVGLTEMRRPAVRRIRARLEVSASFGDLMRIPDRRRHTRGFWASAAKAECCRRAKRQGARSRGCAAD